MVLSGINAPAAQFYFVFAGEHFQSVSPHDWRKRLHIHNIWVGIHHFILVGLQQCTSLCCLSFDERVNPAILTSCEASCDIAPATSMETNNRSLLWTRATRVHILDIQRCCTEEISLSSRLLLQVDTNYRRCVSKVLIIKPGSVCETAGLCRLNRKLLTCRPAVIGSPLHSFLFTRRIWYRLIWFPLQALWISNSSPVPSRCRALCRPLLGGRRVIRLRQIGPQ